MGDHDAMPAELSLTEIARLLGVPQHRLIYLCEKGGVVPDFGDAEGRGSSRLFSTWNLLELAIALHLRRLGLGARLIAGLLHALREFQRTRCGGAGPADFLGSLLQPEAEEVGLVVRDGESVFFTLRSADGTSRTLGGIALGRLSGVGRPRLRRSDFEEIGAAEMPGTSPHGRPAGSGRVRLEVDVTAIARGLQIEE